MISCIGAKTFLTFLLRLPKRGAKYYSMYVCLFVCLFVCLSTRISQKPRLNFTKYLFMLPKALAWFSSGGVAKHTVCYVLPVLQMTSRLHTMGLVRQIQAQRMFRRSSPLWRYTSSGVNLVQSLGDEKKFCRPPKFRNLGGGDGEKLTVSWN